MLLKFKKISNSIGLYGSFLFEEKSVDLQCPPIDVAFIGGLKIDR